MLYNVICYFEYLFKDIKSYTKYLENSNEFRKESIINNLFT